MQIEKLNENKIRFIFSNKDLEGNNINLHSLMSNSIESQNLFTHILDIAENKFNFKTGNSKLIVETIATSSGYFIFTITKIANKKAAKVINGEKICASNNVLTICKFDNFDDFCNLCTYLEANLNFPISYLKDSFLYLYNNNYYLLLNNTVLDEKLFKFLCYSITEFASFVDDCYSFENKLKTSGKLIMKNNAVSTCLKYF